MTVRLPSPVRVHQRERASRNSNSASIRVPWCPPYIATTDREAKNSGLADDGHADCECRVQGHGQHHPQTAPPPLPSSYRSPDPGPKNRRASVSIQASPLAIDPNHFAIYFFKILRRLKIIYERGLAPVASTTASSIWRVTPVSQTRLLPGIGRISLRTSR